MSRTKENSELSIMEQKRMQLKKVGQVETGTKMVDLTNGNKYYYLSGKKDKNSIVVTENIFNKALQRKKEDEKSNPATAGQWSKYIFPNEKITVNSNDILPLSEYTEFVNTPKNKAMLTKLEKAETTRDKIQAELTTVLDEIKSLNDTLVSSIRANS